MRIVRSATLTVLCVALVFAHDVGAQEVPPPAPLSVRASLGPRRNSGILTRASALDDQNLIHKRVSRSPVASRAVGEVLPPTPESRHRNVLFGAIAGAAAGAVVTAAVCADSDGVCLFSPAVLFPIGGAAAGILVALLLTPVR